jgi:hypothetical protein
MQANNTYLRVKTTGLAMIIISLSALIAGKQGAA